MIGIWTIIVIVVGLVGVVVIASIIDMLTPPSLVDSTFMKNILKMKSGRRGREEE